MIVGGGGGGWQVVAPSDIVGGTSVGGSSLFMPGAEQLAGGGGEMVGGSWSPEPADNLPILNGYYSSSGTYVLPSANYVTYPPVLGSSLLGMPPGFRANAATAAQQQAASPERVERREERAARPTREKADKPAASDKPAATADTPAEPKTYTVKKGDWLSKIAPRVGTTWQELYELNKDVIGPNPDVIKPGQVLKLP